MLPILIVESDGLREFLMHLDPKFSILDVYKIKYGTLTNLMIQINSCIETDLDQMAYCNISLDLWSDAIVGAFNAVVCQGIDNEWEMKVIPIPFQHIPGSHTHEKIKKQYDQIKNFNLNKKVYKIITDQVSNMKSAYSNIIETVFPPKEIETSH